MNTTEIKLSNISPIMGIALRPYLIPFESNKLVLSNEIIDIIYYEIIKDIETPGMIKFDYVDKLIECDLEEMIEKKITINEKKYELFLDYKATFDFYNKKLIITNLWITSSFLYDQDINECDFDFPKHTENILLEKITKYLK